MPYVNAVLLLIISGLAALIFAYLRETNFKPGRSRATR